MECHKEDEEFSLLGIINQQMPIKKSLNLIKQIG